MLRTKMPIGTPSVWPSSTPDWISATSSSLRGVVILLWPGRRRFSSCWMSSTLSGILGGQPSTTTPMPGPWDSPQVLMRKSVPKLLAIGGHVGVQGSKFKVQSCARDRLRVECGHETSSLAPRGLWLRLSDLSPARRGDGGARRREVSSVSRGKGRLAEAATRLAGRGRAAFGRFQRPAARFGGERPKNRLRGECGHF